MTRWYVSYSWSNGIQSGFGSIYFTTTHSYMDEPTLKEFKKQIDEKNGGNGQNSIIISFHKIDN